MPSRKRNKGRQRKARAASQGVGPPTPRSLPSAIPNHQTLQLGCGHGLEQIAVMMLPEDRKRVSDYLNLYKQRWRELSENEGNTSSQVGEGGNVRTTLSAYRAIKLAHALQPEILGDSTLRESVKWILLWQVTKAMLEAGNCESNIPGYTAHTMVIILTENYDESSSEPCAIGELVFWKNRRVFSGCWRSLVKFYANRIPCNCLDRLLSEVQSQPKTGVCVTCTEKKDLSDLKVCNGCKAVDYCSVECQESDWPRHQKCCKKFSDVLSKK